MHKAIFQEERKKRKKKVIQKELKSKMKNMAIHDEFMVLEFTVQISLAREALTKTIYKASIRESDC